jgi:hypothetical protein
MVEMKKLKPRKPPEPSVLEQLSAPLRSFVADFQEHGADTAKKVREENPQKYLEIATKLLPLIVALNPATNEFADCQNMNDIGARMLKSVGADESAVTDAMVAQAIAAHDAFVARLEAIRDRAQGKELN